ncbi:MAG: hypothetical protein IJ612_00615 [Prevotella sp.]|nr:hypothetical protein [Prevotella sp.]
MKPKLLLFILLWMLGYGMTGAQKRLVAIDADYHFPVAGASVTTNGGVSVTDSLGRFEVPIGTDLLFITHLNYENRLVKLSEVRDTVFLISNSLNLNEVTVFGVGTDDKMAKLNKQLRLQQQEAQLLNANPNQGLNLLALFKALIPRKWLRNTKAERRKQLEKLLEEY